MKKILVPIDFSKCSTNALQFAFEIAARTGAGLHLLHVVYPSEGVDSNVYQAIWIDKYLEERRQSLLKLGKRMQWRGDFRQVPVKAEVAIGFPATISDETAEQIHADLIVMGTTGATGLRGAVLGSTASTLVARTRRPVLVVPPKASFKSESRWAFATDFRLNLDKKSLSVLESVVAAMQANLSVLHILTQPGAAPNREQEAAFSKKLGDLPKGFHYLHDSDVSQAVNDFVESTATAGLVAVAHEHGLWHRMFYESNAKLLAQQVLVPVLVLHDSK